MLYKVLQTVAQ